MVPTPSTTPNTPPSLQSLSPQDRKRLQALVQRYRIRSDTTLRPMADVAYDLRTRHGLDVTIREVYDLLNWSEESGVEGETEEGAKPDGDEDDAVQAEPETIDPDPVDPDPLDDDDLAVELACLARLASVVLNEHVNADGVCAACPGVVFPCELALTAEHNVALL